jgi:hypothetical protein
VLVIVDDARNDVVRRAIGGIITRGGGFPTAAAVEIEQKKGGLLRKASRDSRGVSCCYFTH